MIIQDYMIRASVGSVPLRIPDHKTVLVHQKYYD